ncbi:MAG TPA: hypothetical protein VF607_08950, partial [Verrucomicrobiae bacterium]
MAAGAASLCWGADASPSSVAALSLNGGVYTPAGVQPGEQLGSVTALYKQGGLIVWQDNTVGKGFAIRAKMLGPDLSASSSAFTFAAADSDLIDDQENPAAAIRPDGVAVVAWQSGVRGQQNTKIRFFSGGAFTTAEIRTAGGTNVNEMAPSVTFLSDGTALVAWASQDLTQGPAPVSSVWAQRFSVSGQKVGSLVQINDPANSNQRSVTVAPMQNGGFAAAWVNETEGDVPTADVQIRAFDASNAVVSSQRVNMSSMTCDAPKLAAMDGGKLLAVWSQVDISTNLGWNVVGRGYDAQAQSMGPSFQINTTTAGNQLEPRIASAGAEAFV